MKRWMALLISLAALCLPVRAYDYELDPQTGEPIGAGGNSFYEMPDGARYIYDTGRYVYQTGGVEFAANVPNNALVGAGETVSLWPSSGSAVLVYRDGGLLDSPSLQSLSQSGSYVVNVTTGDPMAGFTFRFTIVPELTGRFTELTLPEGFLLDYVLLDTVPQELPYGDFFHISADGAYQVQYSCAALQRSFVLRFTLDTTPPALLLPDVIEGEAHGAVTISVPEPGAYIEISRDGDLSVLRAGSQELRQPGRYQLKVYDQAGNMAQYDFTIQFYLDISATAAIALLAAALLGILVYCWLVRKNARVG